MIHDSVAVLMTCYNRRDKTLACLHRLDEQDILLQVYLVDDASNDGTAEAVHSVFPSVKILPGNGNLFWCGGMRIAFAEALKVKHDYYVWLNDDTMLYENTLERLIQSHQSLIQKGKANSIVVGSVCDPMTKQLTYGGRVRKVKWLSYKLQTIVPGSELRECDTFQGNIVLIPHSVAEIVGNIDSAFIHNFGDLDYGLRAVEKGCSVWIAPGYLGECARNLVQNSWVDMHLSTVQRVKKVNHVKNFPIKPWATYLRRHAGPLWFIRWYFPYIRALIGYRDLDKSSTFRKPS